MNKELSPLEKVLARLVHNLMYAENAEQCDEDIKTLKSALKDYEKIKAQDKFVDEVWKASDLPNYSKEAKEHNKQLKALEIIKRKMVDISDLIHSKNLIDYNNGRNRKWYLSQEEFDLLKGI